jgi:eukaryotic-like serine/threonine-protein kinase
MTTILDGRYQIIKKLGQGGFAATYLARNLASPEQSPCVIKHLKPRVKHPKVLQLFKAEARVLDLLSHARIPNSTDCFERNGEMFLVQDFVAGADLGKQYLRGRSWSGLEIKDFLLDMLEVLVHVHQHQIVHRDIKPENIIQRSADDRYVLIDFGAVKELNAPEHSGGALVVGTAGYRSPEHLRGEPGFASDIYGLGITAIQLLTKTHPSRLPKVADHLSWRENALIAPELADVIDRMICPQVVDRYQSAHAVIADLQQLSDTAVTAIVRSQPLETAKKPRSNWKTLLFGVLCIVTLLGMGMLYGYSQSIKFPAPKVLVKMSEKS